MMGTVNRSENTALLASLAQLLEANRANLDDRYQHILRETLFLNRTALRPNMVKNIASEELEAISDFLGPAKHPALEHGSHLYEIGLSEQVLLSLGQILRLFFLPHLAPEQVAPMLEVIDSYQTDVILGFIRSLEKGIFSEQELTRKAFQRASHQD